MTEDEADKIIERLTKTQGQIRMEEITGILNNTTSSEFGHRTIQLLILELYDLSLKENK